MKKRPLGMACLAVAVLLYLYVRAGNISYTDYSEHQGQLLTVTGKVYKKETVTQTSGITEVLYLALEQPDSTLQQKKNTGSIGKRVICYLKKDQPEVEIGSYVQLQGKLACFEKASNPGQFDAYSYYQISEISYRLNQAEIKAKTREYNQLAQGLYRLRLFFSEKLREGLDEKEASIMQTMLLGEKSSMDKDLKALYQRNGIAHILAISGLHVSLLGMGIYNILRKCKVPVKLAAGLAAGILLLYGMMTGFSVSALRAILMFAIRMAAVIFERTYDMPTAAALAAVLILLRQPLYFFHSGFLFSFGCVLGIGLLLPVLQEGMQKWHFVFRSFISGVGMTVITLPIYLWFYYQYPVCSVLLNLIVIPLTSFLVAAGFGLIGLEILWPTAAVFFAIPIKAILKLYEILLKFCDGFTGNILTTGRPEEWQIVVYLCLLIFILLFKKRLKPIARWGIVLAAIMVLLFQPKGKMEITFLDVGQGDCIFIANDNGECYLVDGGSSSVKGVGEYRIIPFLKFRGVSTLEAVFITHPDEDHCNGIKELLKAGREQGISIKHLILPDIARESKNQAYVELEQMAALADIPVFYISRGEEITEDKLKLTCLYPVGGETAAESNEYSLVLEITYGNFRTMLTGDLEGNGEQRLLRYLEKEEGNGRLTVLKIAHHGSAYSTSDEFLGSQRPAYAIISCGRNNSYGHPHKELIKRLLKYDANIFITHKTGAVTFTTDGQKLKVARFLSGES